MKTANLKVMDGFYSYSYTMPSGWAASRWVFIYLFSDAAINKYGHGIYAYGVGS